MNLSGRVVLITGASGGLGMAVTQAFSAAGATIAAVKHGTPSSASEFAADLTSPESTAALAASVTSRLGPIAVLLHLAGGFGGGTPVQRTDDGVWRRMFDLNVNSAFYLLRAVIPPMLEAGSGRIVAIGSRTAVEPAATLSAYGASKAALVALIRTTALELRNSGVTANVVLPSVIDTPANRAADPSGDYSRWVKPASIASLLLWLVSDAAAGVNGAAIPIYGGM